ncbi:cytochrome P450 4A24-like isoform X1 [Ruditapes philippinarum]|uniref:cytochrome P450 4A24-like isoform X1 n=1 Tax=Ruditapes philippinarum TaxID=129788 RepID=UPI00295B5763|nr:cytochrome P450 4A24-like isoform X1 [Ruditapes philippinarum]
MSLLLVTYLTLIIVITYKIVLVVYNYIETIRVARKVPGFEDTRFIQGDLWMDSYDDYLKKSLDFVQTTGVKMHKIWVYFFYPVYCLSHPDTAKVILKSSLPKDLSIGSNYHILKTWTGNGILTNAGGSVWKRHRRLLSLAYHFDILHNYVIKFNTVAEELLIRLSQCRDTSIEICQPVYMATVDASLQCAFSYHGGIQNSGLDHPYVAAIHELTNYCFQRMSNPLLYPDFIFERTRMGKRFHLLCKYIHRFVDGIIKARGHTALQEPDFLDILMTTQDENGVGLNDTEIRDEVKTFLFAGHNTVSSAISWSIYLLGKYPEIQENIYEEVIGIVGTANVKWDHLSKMTCLNCFIKEVLRMYSIVPVIRRTLETEVTIENVTLPSGATVEINIHTINHNSVLWPDHQDFRPERFLDATLEKDPFSFIPFSAGSRNCIGKNFALNELKVILSRIVQTFRIELDRSHKVIQETKLVRTPKTGIKVYLHSR